MSNNKISINSNNSYAQALFELANEENSLKKIEEQVLAISKLINVSEEFRYLIKNPTTSLDDLIKVMETISEKNDFDNLLKRFLVFLIQKRRFFYLEKILIDFLEVCSRSRGEIKAELFSAKELSETDISNIKDELSQNFGANIKLNYKYDPNLIGGLILKVGSTMVDNSIKNKLQQIQKQMIEA
ncbi:ATP synthase F1 subunit delta [Candidatus Pelagibacter sp.]|nr:ATP synthase F1 subunit delta [Candidatus Pelagibacter sp.]MDC3163638.1 ATP synthase F1 subunit delta [Candidatus Pelagibacter sp.]